MKIKMGLSLALSLIASFAAAGPEEELIKSRIAEIARIESSFSRTLDAKSVLNIYSKAPVLIDNGEIETIDQLKQTLMDIEEMVKLGKAIGLSNRPSNIQAQLLSPMYALATHDYTYKAAIDGNVIAEQLGKCTTVMKKYETDWFIHYRHCSTLKPENSETVAASSP